MMLILIQRFSHSVSRWRSRVHRYSLETAINTPPPVECSRSRRNTLYCLDIVGGKISPFVMSLFNHDSVQTIMSGKVLSTRLQNSAFLFLIDWQFMLSNLIGWDFFRLWEDWEVLDLMPLGDDEASGIPWGLTGVCRVLVLLRSHRGSKLFDKSILW